MSDASQQNQPDQNSTDQNTENSPAEQSPEQANPYASPKRQKFDFTTLNTLAVVSLATALSSIGAVAAVITGHISLAQIKRSNEAGRGLAITGLVLGYLTIAGWIIFGILAVVAKAFIYRDIMGLQPMMPGWFDVFERNRFGGMFDR